MTDSIPPPFCRQGNKYKLRNVIIPLIPEHKRYVELFAGSGAIFYNKDKAEENILNDLDKKTIANFRLIKNAPLDPKKYENAPETIPAMKYFFDHHGDSIVDRLIAEKIRTCTGFSGKPVVYSKNIYKPSALKKVVKLLGEYKAKLKGVKLENKDYETIVKKYDGKDTFFFIDPPYENTDNTSGYAQTTDFDFDRLKNVLLHIKGNFLMTINDSKRIRDLFKGFHITPIKVTNPYISRHKNVNPFRNELVVRNYTLV
jgi:DNA adenine methylase